MGEAIEMYAIKPSRVFVSDRVLRNEEAMRRLSSFLEATGGPAYEVVEDARIPWMLSQPEWTRCRGLAGSHPRVQDPVFFFNTFRFDGGYDAVRRAVAEANPGLKDEDLGPRHSYGYLHITWFNSGQDACDIKPNSQHICRPCWRLNFSPGCVHECLYCGCVGAMTVGLNVGDYLQELERVIQETPWQLTYLADDASDLLILEPELGLVREVCEFFGRQVNPDRYFIIHTKSANVDFLRDVDHRGHTIMCWSLSGQTQSTKLEAVSGSMMERLQAAARCQEWGFPVRFKFKPFIPVRGWRDEARDMIRQLFAHTRPDNLSMTVLMWMRFAQMEACLDLNELDPEFVDAARRYAGEVTEADRRTGPFPPAVRQTIYEFLLKEIRAVDREVPVTISTESEALWRVMGPQLGVGPGEYVCGCGPCAVPGLKRLPQNAWRVARDHVPARIRAGQAVPVEE